MKYKFKLSLISCLFLSAISYGLSAESVSAPVDVHHTRAALKVQRNTSSQDDEKSNYKGSQADNKTIKSLSESVNPATGALSVSLPLLSVKGFIPLDVSVSFSAGSSGMLGLPNGWQFNIDSVVPGKSVTFNGRTYVIDFNWSDSTGYQSGLKYLNQHGVLFKDMITNTPLPASFADSRAYRYRLSMPDGSADYFDATGKLIAKGDRFGNHIRYDYNDPEMGVQHNYLKSITDSLGQVFNFGYSANELSVSTVDSQNRSHTQSLAFNQNGILSYTDALGFITQLNYQTRNGVPVVNQIIYPNGLETDITYQDLHFKTADGKVGALNAVATINHIDHVNAHQVLAEADYGFSESNFTGYPNYPLSDDKDSLMESNNPDYRYTVTVTEHSSTASNAMGVRKIQTIYNAMSEPVEQDVYLPGDSENTPTYKTTSSYQLIPDKHAQTVNYNKPIIQTSAIYDAATKVYTTLSKTNYTYDNYGNTLTTDTFKYNPLIQKLVESTKSINTYDPTFNQTLTTINMTWNPLNNTFDTKSVQNTLSNDHKNVLQSTLYDGDINATNGWKSTDYNYDSHGDVIQTTVKWSQSGHAGVTSSTVKDNFSYDPNKRLETITHTDALGSVTTKISDSITGDLLSQTSALGNIVTSSYDLDGRVLKKTLPAGQSITYQYEDYQKDKQNSVTEISPLGAKTTTQYDASNHKITTYSNTDPNNVNDMVLQESDRYNAYGELVQKKDVLGNVTSYSYNALSLPTAQTDSDGNVTTMQYDFAHLSQTSFVNGIKTKIVIYNADKKPLKTMSYPNSHNPLQPHYHLEEISTLDGNNQVLQTIHNKVDDNTGAVTVLNTLTSSYTPDGKTQSQILQSGQSKETITAEYDLLDDVLDKTKTLDFSDSTGSHHDVTQRDHFSYDATGELIAETNQAGQSINYSYDQDGNKVTETRLDGTVVHFTYDKDGNLTTKTYTDNSGKHSYNYSYDPDGNKTYESLDGQGIKISYTLSGLQTATSYPDGKVATATYNKYGQLLSSTDVNGQQTTMTYLKDGKLDTVSNNQDKVTYLYSTQDKPNENNQYGALIAKDYQGIYTQQFTADAFGQEHELKQIDSLGTTLLDVVNTFDAKGMLTDVTATSDKAPNDPNVNYVKHYTYDELNQLIKEKTDNLQHQPLTSTEFIYDGNGNILSKVKDAKTTTYQYNNLDQLVSYTEDGSTYTPKYNANGDEVDDGKGTSYQFNGISQLIGVQNQATHLAYDYYANGLRADRINSTGDHHRYYYTGDTISAVNDLTHPDNVSFFLDGKNRIHAYSVS
ncbi:hypothetical protein [Cysteiniphilum sp. 6C5]|uniref:hypothetical protein n=1 Tax=unclassified Cysteiniphilum TaxID=2610889 RepID=UPI003F82C584